LILGLLLWPANLHFLFAKVAGLAQFSPFTSFSIYTLKTNLTPKFFESFARVDIKQGVA